MANNKSQPLELFMWIMMPCRIVILVLFLFLIASQHWGMKVRQPIILRLLRQVLMM